MKLTWPALRGFNIAALRLKSADLQRLFILGAIVLFMYQGVGIFYKILGMQLVMTPAVAPPVEAVPAVLRAPPKEAQDYYRIVAERNLFGSTDKTLAEKLTEKQGKSAAVQPLTTLLELRGTVAGIGKLSFAVIEEKGKNKQGLFRVGDKIVGATLIRVMRDQVALKINHKEEILKKRDATETAIVPPKGVEAPAADGSPGAMTLNRGEMAASLKDMGQMMSQAQVRPYFYMGMPDGFMVSSIRQGSMYQKMGLVDGDVIQELNSQKLTGADDMVGLYNAMKSGSAMSLKIKRAGKQETLNYQFK
jgi:general secretion pathway protein C